MATVKLSGGKVVLKSGKVSCSCCDAACCLYPWPDPDGTPLYPDTDLPDSVVVNGDTYTRSGYRFEFDSDHYIDATELGIPFWGLFINGDATANTCLIGLYEEGVFTATVEDEFANTYTVNGTDTITRDPATNLCLWSGSTWTLRYNSTTYQFELNGTAKTGDQDTPAGTYGTDTVA